MGDLDEMIRREFMRLMAITGALLPARDALAAVDASQSAETCGSPGAYEMANAHLWKVFSLTASKRALYPIVREQLSGLSKSLKEASTHEEHKKLCAATGNLFQLAGEIFFDGNRYTESAHCYSLAASASKEADEYDLWACALTRHAFIGMHERQFSETVPLLEAASLISQRGSSKLSTRYWVSAVQAETFARLGDFESCRRSLDAAEHVLSLSGDAQNGGLATL
ncbi:hypothetical protein [Streptomyces sp. SM12]|uniref:hypothetical protein n=1 Tax=Streptomyces sp. SM12 TaxID=1071602 RepID=UPI0021565815|nr:hypothetical protein [Streptomyces sp. SM12]